MELFGRTVVLLAFYALQVWATDMDGLENWKCSRPGLNPHPRDCHNFVLCLDTDDGLKVESSYRCPDTFAFSSTSNTCVDQNKVPGCRRRKDYNEDESEEDGYSKRRPVVTSCKRHGAFCFNQHVLAVCTETRVPVLVLDCRQLDPGTPNCEQGTCMSESKKMGKLPISNETIVTRPLENQTTPEKIDPSPSVNQSSNDNDVVRESSEPLNDKAITERASEKTTTEKIETIVDQPLNKEPEADKIVEHVDTLLDDLIENAEVNETIVARPSENNLINSDPLLNGTDLIVEDINASPVEELPVEDVNTSEHLPEKPKKPKPGIISDSQEVSWRENDPLIELLIKKLIRSGKIPCPDKLQ